MKKIKIFQVGLMSPLLFQASSCIAHGNPTTEDELNKAQKESKNVLLIVTDDKKNG